MKIAGWHSYKLARYELRRGEEVVSPLCRIVLCPVDWRRFLSRVITLRRSVAKVIGCAAVLLANPACAKESQDGNVSSLLQPGYPLSLPLCSLPATLQECIRRNRKVRVLPKSYLQSTDGSSLTLESDQAIYGLRGSKLPPIRIAPASRRVVISGIETASINLDTGLGEIQNLVLYDLHANINASGTMLVDSMFIRVAGQILIDNATSGYARRNTFIGCRVHGASPGFVLKGNATTPSGQTRIIAHTFQTPAGAGAFISEQSQVGIYGMSAESWNFRNSDNLWAPLLDVTAVRNFALVSAAFGTSSRFPTPFVRLNGSGAELINIYGSSLPYKADGLRGPWSVNDLQRSVIVNGGNIVASRVTSNIVVPRRAAHGMQAPANETTFQRFGKPHCRLVKPGWIARPRKSRHRSRSLLKSGELQRLIDDAPDGIVYLPPGRVILTSPLRLRHGQGIVGSGSSETILEAPRGMDVVQIISVRDRPKIVSFILSNLTLRGGKVGLMIDGSNRRIVINDIYVADLAIEGARQAGIQLVNTGGFDNNLLYGLRITGSPIGIDQVEHKMLNQVDDDHTNYVDKLLIVNSLFNDNILATSFQAGRANNQISFVGTTFINNKNGAYLARNTVGALFYEAFFSANGAEDIRQVGNVPESALAVVVASAMRNPRPVENAVTFLATCFGRRDGGLEGEAGRP